MCNVVGSTIARETDGGIYLHAGPEIGVASTKAFTSQVPVLAMLALFFGRSGTVEPAGARMIEDLRASRRRSQALRCHDEMRQIAEKYQRASTTALPGPAIHVPRRPRRALKLKEISYIHAEGYPAAEMKHGPIALVDADTPSVFLMPCGSMFDKVMSNLEEVKAAAGRSSPSPAKARGAADHLGAR